MQKTQYQAKPLRTFRFTVYTEVLFWNVVEVKGRFGDEEAEDEAQYRAVNTPINLEWEQSSTADCWAELLPSEEGKQP